MDVAFSIDHLAARKEPEAWDGEFKSSKGPSLAKGLSLAKGPSDRF